MVNPPPCVSLPLHSSELSRTPYSPPRNEEDSGLDSLKTTPSDSGSFEYLLSNLSKQAGTGVVPSSG